MKPRQHILSMSAYLGEIPVPKLAKRIGKQPEEIIKAEFNESSYGPNPKIIDALKKFIETNNSKYGKLNYYPFDIEYKAIRNKLAKFFSKKFSSKNILLGNGSNEIIDLAIKTFVNPNQEEVLIMEPVFGGYKTYLKAYNVKINSVICRDNLTFDVNDLKNAMTLKTKLVFICHPNNPTGILFSRKNLIELIELYRNTMFFVDEAYIDFSRKDSFISLIENYNNLIISRTFSKAYSLAGLRLGYAVSSSANIEWMSRVRVSYTANIVSIIALDTILDDKEYVNKVISKVNNERKKMIAEMKKIKIVSKVYDSCANFILVRFNNAIKVFNYLLKKGIIVRNYTKAPKLDNCLRITICRENENRKLIETLRNFK